ncbi:MAG: hypothetical protein HOP10_11155 [Chitinophagaceae bacterium]|nr:hypothetical protein [Chitinophagaceae bacterium]
MLTPKEQKTLARLEETMRMPAWKFILIYGLIFGVLLAIITSVIDVLAGGVPVSELFRKRLWINLAMAPVAGVFFGYILRWMQTKQYQKLKEKEHLP